MAVQRARQLALPVINGRTPGMPHTRAECADGPRPCPWVRCRHHLWLVTDRPGIRRFPGDHPPHIVVQHSEETCSLDVAVKARSYEEIATVMGMKAERARQVSNAAEKRMRAALEDWHREEWGDAKCEYGCDICNSDDFDAEPGNTDDQESA